MYQSYPLWYLCTTSLDERLSWFHWFICSTDLVVLLVSRNSIACKISDDSGWLSQSSSSRSLWSALLFQKEDVSNRGRNIQSRFVLGIRSDRDKRAIFHNKNMQKQSSIIILTALAATLKFALWTADIQQHYLQSASKLKIHFFIKPNELVLTQHELIQILNPHIRTTWLMRLLGERLTNIIWTNSKWNNPMDNYSHFQSICKELKRILVTYADDVYRTGNQ